MPKQNSKSISRFNTFLTCLVFVLIYDVEVGRIFVLKRAPHWKMWHWCCPSRSNWQVDSNNADTNASLVGTHRRYKSPPVGLRVIALDRVQIGRSVIATDGVQLAAACRQSHPTSLDIHRRNSSPEVGCRVVAFDGAQEHIAVVAASYVHFAVQCSNAKSTSL